MQNDKQDTPNGQWDPDIFVIEAAGKTNTHIRGFYGDSGENESVLSVMAFTEESPMFPDNGRILVGTPQKSPLLEGYFPDLGGFCCSVEAMERFIAVAQKAVNAVKAAKAAGR